MDKLDLHSKSVLGGNIEKIGEIFPGVITEAADESGKVTKAIDFDLLRQHLSDHLVEGDRERFRLDWPGKRASILKANTPTTKTLRPMRDDSEDFDTTQNVFIEGDNFEVLKVLQESYLGKIKMIYIDPPYNTGKDFIYRDNFTQDKGDYEEELGVRDEETDGKLVKNTETNGRYHSDWLSMMQERLTVARDLLTDDGVIFISIGDDEQANLTSLCNEIFGEENFLGLISRRQSSGSKNDSGDDRVVATVDYVLPYRKSNFRFSPIQVENKKKFSYSDKEGAFSIRALEMQGGGDTLPQRPKMGYSIYYNKESNDVKLLSDYDLTKDPVYREPSPELLAAGYECYRPRPRGDMALGIWRWGDVTFMERFTAGGVYFESGRVFLKERASDTIEKYPEAMLDGYLNTQGTNAVKSLFSERVFSFPKPVSLIKYLLQISTKDDDVVLDFFSGSGTTAHAVMQLNAEDGGNRKHIQVQLAEPADPSSEAYKAGYKTIPEISRERIRRAAAKIREDYAEQIAKRDIPLDTGFRAYKLASSNFTDTRLHPSETSQTALLDVADTIKDDRTSEDILTEVMLDLGLTLDLPIEQRDVAGHNVYFVAGNSLVACFDDEVSLDIVDEIAKENPLLVVFKDSSFQTDEARINVEIRLKQLIGHDNFKIKVV